MSAMGRKQTQAANVRNGWKADTSLARVPRSLARVRPRVKASKNTRRKSCVSVPTADQRRSPRRQPQRFTRPPISLYFREPDRRCFCRCNFTARCRAVPPMF